MKEIVAFIICWNEFITEWKERPEKMLANDMMIKPEFFDFMEWLSKKSK